jgi:hypothetical protein
VNPNADKSDGNKLVCRTARVTLFMEAARPVSKNTMSQISIIQWLNAQTCSIHHDATVTVNL